MKETPERQGFKAIKEAVKQRRLVKDHFYLLLKEKEVKGLRGGRSERLNRILRRTDQVLFKLQEKHSDWIEQKYQLLGGYLSKINPAVVEEMYRAGLATTIVQEFRIYEKSEEVARLNKPKYLQGVITGYTVDFYRSLRLSQRLGINPNVALRVAQLSYRYNPTELIELIRQYPDVNLSVITSAALHYPTNPEGFIEDYIKTLERLRNNERYRNVGLGVITSAALHYPTNPEEFIDDYIEGGGKIQE